MKLSPTWQNNMALMRWVINQPCRTNIEKLHQIIRTGFFSVDCPDADERKLSINASLKVVPYPIGSESIWYPDDLVTDLDGKRLSCDYIKKSWLASLVGYGHNTLLEVGAGFGQVGRILLQNRRINRYVVIDIPETLWFAEVFLRTELHDRSIIVADSASDCSKTPDVLLIPVGLAHHYKQRTDCFLNSSSLGEMDASYAKFYINMAQGVDLGVKRIVLLNRLMNTYSPARECNRENECAWYFALDRKWAVEQWELEPPFTRLPYEQAMHHRELLFVANRGETDQSLPDLTPIRHQRWFKDQSHRASDRRGNQMFIDNNTARTLFESVRCNPTGDNIDMLLRYMRSFGKKYPFEEEQWLARRYEEITGKAHPVTYGWARNVVNRVTTKAAQVAWKFRSSVANGAHGDHATGSSLCLPHETKPR